MLKKEVQMLQKYSQDQFSHLWLGQSAPRYTSYPTAPHFENHFSPDSYANWLKDIDKNSAISLYIHIPYCKKLCWFCGCNKEIVHSYKPVAAYLIDLKKEISLVREVIGGKLKVNHLHFGGGSPTILNPEDFKDLMSYLRENFTLELNAEIAIEIDPRTMTKEKAAAYAECGVNRASLGVQDFTDKVQIAINRVQPYSQVEESCNMLRAVGINQINLDLIYGLPYQTKASFYDTIEQAVKLLPSRIAVFSYAHVTWIQKGQKIIDEKSLPSDEEKLGIYFAARELLQKIGFVEIGIDHFALKGDSLTKAMQSKTLKRNFQGYSSDKENVLIGLGVSSIGFFPQGYIQNLTKAEEYHECVEKGILPVKKGFAISAEDKLRKEIIDNLMCYLQVDIAEIAQKYGKKAEDFSAELAKLEPYLQAGIIEIDASKISVTSKYRMAVRAICTVFDQYMTHAANQYSKVS